MVYGLSFSHALSLISCRCCSPAIFLTASTFVDYYITLLLTTPSNIVKEKIGESKKLNEIDRKTFCIYRAFKSFDSSIFFNSDLSKEEPQRINRHWDLHGRTHREHDKIDFLKVLLWLDAIIFMSRQDLQQSEEGE